MHPSREFVMRSLKEQIGRRPYYSIQLLAVDWLDKGVLLVQDLQALDAAMIAWNEAKKEEEASKAAAEAKAAEAGKA